MRVSKRWMVLAAILLVLLLVGGDYWRRLRERAEFHSRAARTVELKAETPRRRPLLGTHFIFADPPQETIFEMVQPDRQAELAGALREAGIEDLRMSFHGYYSHFGTEATARLKRETKLTNTFPWFPIEIFISFIQRFHFTTVLGINVEEGPEAAVDLLERFARAGALNLITSVELGNEPFLSPRPWHPEEYAEKCAQIIERLRPYKVKFAVAVVVGKDRNMPIRLTGDEYCQRILAALDDRLDLHNSDDIYGAFHIYSRGVTPVVIDQVNSIVRKYSSMKYQITEYNIRLSLKGNPHLTNAYAREFARKLNRLIINPDIDGLWIHAFPFHSLSYWTDGRRATIIGFQDKKLQGDDWRPGWHLTPAGRVHKFFQQWAWNGEIVAFLEQGDVQYWAVRTNDGKTLISIFNDRDTTLEQEIHFQSQRLSVKVGAYSLASFTTTGQLVTQLALP
ncbi:MAG: hypothetical protein AB1489_16360 [Acidobacteriota bacterium]